MRRIRSHLTYANVMATIAVFLVLSGGTAVALSGTDTVQSDDLGPGSQVKAPDVAANAVNGSDVVDNSIASADIQNFSLGNGDLLTGSVDSRAATDNSLTGADIQNKSGVDTCVNTTRLGDLCFRAENSHRNYLNAAQHCANLNLRLPSATEGDALATNYDLPNVDESESFWTDETVFLNSAFWSGTQDDAGFASFSNRADLKETVCVTTPTN
jgi:hypothetical protein